MSRNARYIVSRIRLILENNDRLLRDKDVKKWLKLVYPLILEHSSARDKEFFKLLGTYLFDEPHH